MFEDTFDTRRVGASAAAVLALMTVIALTVAVPVVGTVGAQETNETATPTPDSADTAEACEPSDGPSLSQSRLYAPEQTINAGQPGQIAGGFQAAADASCPIVVSITMSVPSGMRIAGASDIVSSGAGLATAQFTVQPGEIRDIRANVYSQNTGDRSVTADITYWPEGHEDMSRQIDTVSMTFDVQEAITPSGEDATDGNATGGDDAGSAGPVSNTLLLAFGAFALIVLAIVAVATRSESVNIGITK